MGVSPKDLCEILLYDSGSGYLFWKERDISFFKTEAAYKTWNKRFSGSRAFLSLDRHGYAKGRIFGKRYFAHRVIWAIEYGEWPPLQIDHINGVRNDNRISNLRLATLSDNGSNKRSRGSSQYLGVYWDSHGNKWRAQISRSGRHVFLGSFKDEIDAALAYDEQARITHGEFANTNFSNNGERRAR